MSNNNRNRIGLKNLFIMRHGERVDLTFYDWVSTCFNENGEYARKDLNMPVNLLNRENYVEAYKYDTPLTNIGTLEAKLTGEALALNGVTIKYAYCSPALRCVQTCHGVLTGLSTAGKLPIRIEPGLFEFLYWHGENFPQFMNENELRAGGFNIDTSYTPQMSKSELKARINETCEEYYERSSYIVEKLLEQTELEGPGDVLLVAHAPSLDSCSRLLLGLHPPVRNIDSILEFIDDIPYCSLLQVQQDKSGRWIVAPSRLVPSITHSENKPFNYGLLSDSQKTE